MPIRAALAVLPGQQKRLRITESYDEMQSKRTDITGKIIDRVDFVASLYLSEEIANLILGNDSVTDFIFLTISSCLYPGEFLVG